MNIRPISEEDIEQVVQLFRLNYGDDYAIPEFYDPQWVKRGIYSDHIIWLVIEQAGQVVASGAAMLDFGDYNDQIAEIGRLVVNPAVGGKGLGRTLLDALVDASDDRVEFAFGEAPGDAAFAISVGQILSFTDNVTLGVTGNPAGTTAGFSVNPVTPPGSSVLTISNTGGAAAGSYGITVSGTASGSPGHTTGVVLDVLALPGTPALSSPPNGAVNQPLRPIFEWSAATGADSYWIEVDDDPAFSSPAIAESGILGTSYTPTIDLEEGTTYYWRVTSENVCGPGGSSTVFSFTTMTLLPFEDGFESGDTSAWSATVP